MFKFNKNIIIGISIFLVILFLLFSFTTNHTKNFVNLINSKVNSEVYTSINQLEKDKETYKKLNEEYIKAYTKLEEDSKKLKSDRNALQTKNAVLSDKVKQSESKLKEIKIPKDKDEAAKILNSLGFTVTIRNCN